MLKTPPAEFGEHRYEFDRRLGQRVCDGTTRAGVVAAEQTVVDKVAESAATLRFERNIAAPAERVWNAYADIAQRSVWSVPDGEAVEYDASDFVQGGVDEYRCGPPDD